MRFISLLLAFVCLCAVPSIAAVSTDITLDIKDGQLGATLLLPDGDGPWPVVLILAGAGSIDRDGNVTTFPGKNNFLLQLAEGLAADGVASLRTDKRGIAGSISAGLSENKMRFNYLVDDAVQWASLLQNDQRFSSVSITGQGQGAQVGMNAAWLSGADGYVSLAGWSRPILSILRDQLHDSLNIRSRVRANALLDELEAGRMVLEPPTDMSIILRPTVQEYLMSWQNNDPCQIIGRLSCPVAIIQGLNDLDVSKEDAVALQEANPNATLLLLPGINNLFKPIEDTNPVTHQRAMAHSGLQFSEEAIKAIVALTAKADVFHKQWGAAVDRAAHFNAQAMGNYPPEYYGFGENYQDQDLGQKIGTWIINRTIESHGYRFGLAKDGYATKGALMMDGYYDCVSFMYRCTELARATSLQNNLDWALRTRFAGAHPDSAVGLDGRVDYNRPEHLDYSLDMIRSGIWGRDVSAEIGTAEADEIGTSRYPAGSFSWVPASSLNHAMLQEGDVIWFVLNPEDVKAKNLRDEHGLVVGHLGLMGVHENRLLLTHAASSDLDGEYKGGNVVMVDLATYLQRVDRYAGVFVTRLDR